MLEQSWLDVLKRYGVATVFACALLYWVLNTLTGRLDAMDTRMKTTNDLLQAHTSDASQMIRLLEGQTLLQKANLAATIRTCLGVAKTDADKISCAAVAQ